MFMCVLWYNWECQDTKIIIPTKTENIWCVILLQSQWWKCIRWWWIGQSLWSAVYICRWGDKITLHQLLNVKFCDEEEWAVNTPWWSFWTGDEFACCYLQMSERSLEQTRKHMEWSYCGSISFTLCSCSIFLRLHYAVKG
jgi:hypothetical protein